MNCWICGKVADSREHKFKKSFLTSRYGKGSFDKTGGLVYLNESIQINIQGPEQKHLKFEKTLCSECNNEKTQPFDKAYDQFYHFVYINEQNILHKRFIDFQDVYGTNWQNQQRNLFKYLVKLFGCKIVEANLPVPTDLIELLFLTEFQTMLYINFAVNEDKLLFINDFRDCIGNSDFFTTQNFKNNHTDPKIKFVHYFNFLTISYWYGISPDGKFGSPWTADQRFIYLGSYYPLTEAERSEIFQKVNA